MPISATGHSYVDVESGTVLDVWFPTGDVAPKRSCLAEKVGLIEGREIEVNIEDLDDPAVSTEDVYLRLHLLSRRWVQPNEASMEGVFGFLNSVAWTNHGPVLPERVDALRSAAAEHGAHVTVHGVDKFPRMTDYVTPSGVRIADANRVRLGAHLAEGTTVMHEGFCNFNAGTTGVAMIEGRISQGVVIGENSDLGGGASIQGTLSGGGKEVISIGANCLIGANGGTGISLGDACVVEAGLYVTAGTKVTLSDGTVVRARELSGRPGLMFIRNSTSGVVEVRESDPERWGGLNEALHKN